ncbi:MAG: ABC transporter substrate-binding protein [Zoogloeaceae bacterium]|nr:ABC transporter substrate-binding protein [Zoogloeaceae bacterium]
MKIFEEPKVAATKQGALADPDGAPGAPEKTRLRLGIIPLTDCAVIAVAKEKGYFRREGLEVEISREGSWASIRDRVALGDLDGAQMLAGMPLASALGVSGCYKPAVTAFSMDLNGNGITVSSDLYDRMMAVDPEAMAQRPLSARALRKVILEDRRAGRPRMTFAMVFPVSSHNFALRYWMASGGIDPDRDVDLIVVPPPQMVSALLARRIVGYCVGEPWNQHAVEIGIGRSVITGYELWNNSPEKVFGVNRDWAERHPNTHRALVRALLEAARWMDVPEHREEVVDIIARRHYVDAPADVVASSMTGTWRYAKTESPVKMPDFNVFHRYAANFPWRSHAIWFLTQMVRWGQVEQPINFLRIAESVYRTDIYRAAAFDLGIPVPPVDAKTEGGHPTNWTLKWAGGSIEMGPDRFFDGMSFDPTRPVDYLLGMPLSALKVDIDALRRANA